MSRVGKYPVEIPAGVQVALAGQTLSVKGKNGELKMEVADLVEVKVADGKVSVAPLHETTPARMMWGTTRALIANMVHGVAHTFSQSMEITGTGYRAQVQGSNLVLNLGFSHDVTYPIPAGIKITCEKPTAIKVEGADKRLVGQVCAELRKWRPPEPYKGKGMKFDGEYILRKEGKKK